MARRRRRSSSRKGAHCRTIKGRRICWGANGKIRSNTKASRRRRSRRR